MMNSVWGTVHEGKIELSEPVVLPDGAKVLVTLPSESEDLFWLGAAAPSLSAVWDNAEDDVYAQLLEG